MTRRPRGRGRKPQHNKNQNPNRAMDSNGPDVRVRGSAKTIYDKYISLARDASSSGQRVKAENLLQHAEHYLRIMQELQAAAEARAEKQAKEKAEKQAEKEERRARQDGQEDENTQSIETGAETKDDKKPEKTTKTVKKANGRARSYLSRRRKTEAEDKPESKTVEKPDEAGADNIGEFVS